MTHPVKVSNHLSPFSKRGILTSIIAGNWELPLDLNHDIYPSANEIFNIHLPLFRAYTFDEGI
jgi:hypothetical protein